MIKLIDTTINYKGTKVKNLYEVTNDHDDNTYKVIATSEGKAIDAALLFSDSGVSWGAKILKRGVK
jgi:hypothetical protein